jgi:hypothetical protein
VIEVPLATFTFVAAVPPNLTVAPATKPDPVIVTEVPPLVGPTFGETDVIANEFVVLGKIVESFCNAPGEEFR